MPTNVRIRSRDGLDYYQMNSSLKEMFSILGVALEDDLFGFSKLVPGLSSVSRSRRSMSIILNYSMLRKERRNMFASQ